MRKMFFLSLFYISIVLTSCTNELSETNVHYKQRSFIVDSKADSLVIESGYGSAVDMYISICNKDTSIVRNGFIPNVPIGKDTVNVLMDTMQGEWFTVIKRGDIVYGKEFQIKWDKNETDFDRILFVCIGTDLYDENIKITQKHD